VVTLWRRVSQGEALCAFVPDDTLHMDPAYTAELTESVEYDGESVTELPVVDYEFVGSMYMFDLPNGESRSFGTGVVDTVSAIES
jgi:hypothetical protein